MSDSAKTATKNNNESSLSTIPGLSGVPSTMISTLTRASSKLGSTRSIVSETDLAKGAEEAFKLTDRQEMIKWTLIIIGRFTLLRALASAFFTVILVVGPSLYLYLHQTCPKKDSFDTRKELKRVLRGHHLSEDHPDKPKGYLAGMVARATASVTAESAVLTGYKLELTPYNGAFILAKLDLPSKEMTIYWLGIAGQWRHIHTSQPRVSGSKTD